MAYTVAVDRRKSTDRAWRQAADLPGIPAAFIVDRQGKIAFIGNPHPKVDGAGPGNPSRAMKRSISSAAMRWPLALG